jgi:hypothetical protein
MSNKEILMIEKYLDPSKVMLEYGSGGSTVHFSTKVKYYYSLEHNKDWYKKVRDRTGPNVNLFHVTIDGAQTPGSTPPVAENWSDLADSNRQQIFKNYIRYPVNWGITFDAVLIDGRARPECAKFIYDYLNDGAYVFIHDYWGRKKYHVVEEAYEVVDFVKSGQSLVVLKKK